MKFLLIAMMTLGSFLAKANKTNNDEAVSATVLNAFNTAFRSAENVTWEESKEFYKANFLLNSQHVFAFYAKDGKLMAMTRNLLLTELPVILQTSLKETAGGYWITDLFELSNDEGTTYYLTVENADTRLVLQSSKNSWNLFQKKSK